jgi:hypothetical protein
MSTGLECQFIEFRPSEWYYILQDGSCPVQTWDWREYATAYGPFPDLEKAKTSLRDNHANPGGYWEMEYDPKYERDEVLQRLIANPTRPTADGGLIYQGENHTTYRRGPFIWFR